MSIGLFTTMFLGGWSVSIVLTQAIKQYYVNAHKDYSANAIAFINAIVIGGGFTSALYILLKKEWSIDNIIYLIFMVLAIWMGSMIGFDKIIQTIMQLITLSKNIESKNSGDVVEQISNIKEMDIDTSSNVGDITPLSKSKIKDKEKIIFNRISIFLLGFGVIMFICAFFVK